MDQLEVAGEFSQKHIEENKDRYGQQVSRRCLSVGARKFSFILVQLFGAEVGTRM